MRKFKETLEKYGSNRKNIIISLVVTSTIPAFLIMTVLFFVLSFSKWNTVLRTVDTSFEKAVGYINMELETYLAKGVNIIASEFINELTTEMDTESVEKQVHLIAEAEEFFSNYRSPVFPKFDEFKIYIDNESFLSNPGILRISELDKKLADEALSLSETEILWKTENKNIVFYRKTNNYANKKCILKVTIPEYTINKFLSSVDERGIVSFNDNFNNTENVKKSGFVIKEATLISGNTIKVYIPWKIRNDIFISNLFMIFMIFFIFFILLIRLSVSVSNVIMNNIEGFITGLAEEKILSGQEPVVIDENDEFITVKKGIKKLIDKSNEIHKEIEIVKNEKHKLELELSLTQINPHLLYNSLSVVKWNALRSKNNDIAETIDALILYYRHVLNNGENTVSFGKEIEMVKKYIRIMEYSKKRTYNLSYYVEEGLENVEVIKHLLQPFVENSILHAFDGINDPLIDITAKKEGEYIIINIKDNGCGIKEEKSIQNKNLKNHKSYGLRNTKQRINLYYGEDCGFNIKSEPDKGTEVILKIKTSRSL